MTAPRPLLALLLGLAACEGQAAAPPARPWTLFDLDAAFKVVPPKNVLVGAAGVPGGLPPLAFLKAASSDSAGPVVRIAAAFTEGAPSPYVTTNVWANFPEVWVQPMYILVTRWDEKAPASALLEGAKWIFTVGPQSRFHSPFWQVYWAVVPPGTDKDRYTDSRQLFEDGVVLHPGGGRLVALVPPGTTVEATAGSRPGRVLHEAAELTPRQDWLDGEPVTAIDFGDNRFEWNEHLEVIEQPFFVLATRQSDGSYAPSGAPNVGGTGPLFARRPALVPPNNRPLFGSFWRLHLVRLPPGDEAGLFLPPRFEAERGEVAKLNGLAAPTITWEPSNEADKPKVNARALQVALNAKTCFADETSFASCNWLDSQAAIEKNLPAAISPTGITVTCPFIGYDGKKVPPK